MSSSVEESVATNFWQALVIAIVPSVAVVLTAALGFRDLGMRRRLEMSK